MQGPISKLLFGISQIPPLVGLAIYWDQTKSRPLFALFLTALYELIVFLFAFSRKVWSKIEDQAVQHVADRIWLAIVGFSPGFRRRYKEYIIKEHGIFNVRGIGLINTYTLYLEQVFVELRIAPSSNPQHPNIDLVTRREIAGNRPIWDFLRSVKRSFDEGNAFAVVGPAGSGKTTLLQHIALTLAANHHRRYRIPSYIPILLFLRNHVEAITQEDPPTLARLAKDYLGIRNPTRRLYPPPDWFDKQLERGRCIVLLDGLDEIASREKRKVVAAWVDEQIKNYVSCQFIATARPQGYLDAPLQRADILEVQPFNPSQVQRFIENWYLENEIRSSGNVCDGDVRQRAATDASDLMQRLRRSPALGELTTNPLLLTMIAMVHRYHGTLPESRVELYAEISQVLLGRWRQARGLHDELSAAQKLLVLSPLAAHMMKNKLRDIRTAEVKHVIAPILRRIGITGVESESFLKQLEESSGLLLEREVGHWSFAHLTFQEYLTASFWLEHKGISLDWNEMVGDSWWHETLRLYAAQGDATSLAEACLQADTVSSLILAADCLEEARELDLGIRRAVEEKVIAGLESSDSTRRRIAAEVQLARRLKTLQQIDERRSIDLEYLTSAEYQLFLDDSRSLEMYHQPDHWNGCAFSPGNALTPVAGVRPSDAVSFCKWLTELYGGNAVFRLPRMDEAQRYVAEPTEVATLCQDDEKGFSLVGLSPIARQQAERQLKEISTSSLPVALDLYLVRDFSRQIESDLDSARNLTRSRAVVLDRYRMGPGRTKEKELARDFTITLAHSQDIAITRLLSIIRDRMIGRDLIRDLNLADARELAILLVTDLAASLRADHSRSRNLEDDIDVDISLTVTAMIRAIDEEDKVKASRLFQAVLDDPTIGNTTLGLLLGSILAVVIAESEASARRGQRKYLRNILELAYKGFEEIIDAAFLTRLAEQAGSIESIKTAQQGVLELYSWLQITIAREEGQISAWEGIRIVRDIGRDLHK